jgi:hypothetical protein
MGLVKFEKISARYSDFSDRAQHKCGQVALKRWAGFPQVARILSQVVRNQLHAMVPTGPVER